MEVWMLTNEEISLNTKKNLSQSLKKLIQKKKLDKIKVSYIVEDCHINRKTLYYHFKNIPDLLKWMLEKEAIEIVKQFDLMCDYKEAILFVIDYVKKMRISYHVLMMQLAGKK